MSADERFAKRFGQLQRELGDDIVSFYQDVGELPRGNVSPDQVVFWMDDQRALLVLSVCGPDGGGDTVLVPTSLWQHLKMCRGFRWIGRLLGVDVRTYVFPHSALTGNVRTEADVIHWTKVLAKGAK